MDEVIGKSIESCFLDSGVSSSGANNIDRRPK